MKTHFIAFDTLIASWMSKHGVRLLRICLGIVFIWFGLLKPLGMSPETALIERTVYWLNPKAFLPLLGAWEVLIGVCLLYRPFLRCAGLMLLILMPGTLLPLILLPEVCFTRFPFGLTLEGQYIVKNLILMTAALVVGGTVQSNSCHKRKL